ncbi:MAG: hypothetical protein ABSD56_06070 [Bryobacteraceae bacterium]
MVTLLHVLHVPLALVCGWTFGVLVRKRRLAFWQAYALALAPGVLLALGTAVLRTGVIPRNEQPWQGLLLWATWSALGVLQGWKYQRRAKPLTTLGLSERQR